MTAVLGAVFKVHFEVYQKCILSICSHSNSIDSNKDTWLSPVPGDEPGVLGLLSLMHVMHCELYVLFERAYVQRQTLMYAHMGRRCMQHQRG